MKPLDALFAGHLDLHVEPGWMPPGRREALIASSARLGRWEFSPAFRAISHGRILDQAHDDAADYDAEAPKVHAWAEAEQLDLAMLAALSDRPIDVAAGCVPFTVRELPTGGRIPIHVELEQLARPALARVRVDGVVISWFVVLRAPEAGGELRRWQADGTTHPQVYADRRLGEMALAGVAREDLPPGAGDLVVLDGSRRFHAIQPVIRGERWTLGGFLGEQGGRIIAWS